MSYKKWHIVGAVLVGIVCFCFYQVFLQYTLFFKEQIHLFSFSESYLLAYFAKPAWLSMLAGDFLTQFLYLRGGAVVLAVLASLEWLALVWLINKVAATKYAPLWALIPLVIDIVLCSILVYPLAQPVAMLLLALSFKLYTLLRRKDFRLIFMVIIPIVGYWMFGSTAFALPVLMLVYDIRRKSMAVGGYLLSVLACALVPCLLRWHYLLTPAQAYLYPLKYTLHLLPIVVLCLVAVVAASLSRYENSRPWIWRIAIAAGAAFAAGYAVLHFANFSAEKIYSLDSECYFKHDDKVLELVRKYDLKNKYASYYANIALARKGQLPDSMLNYYQPFSQSLMLPVSPYESWQSILYSGEAYYTMGDMNMAQHSAMLGMIFSPNQRSARLAKRLAEINMVNGDFPAALKYLRMLSATMFYGKWADRRIEAIRTGIMPTDILEKRKQKYTADTIRSVNDHITSLTALVGCSQGNAAALDYLLCYYLLNKDVDKFVEMYTQFGSKVSRPLPEMYSEALLIWLYRNKMQISDLAKYRIPVNKIADFMEYNKYNAGSANIGEDEFVKKFGKTYWFYFQFAVPGNASQTEHK